MLIQQHVCSIKSFLMRFERRWSNNTIMFFFFFFCRVQYSHFIYSQIYICVIIFVVTVVLAALDFWVVKDISLVRVYGNLNHLTNRYNLWSEFSVLAAVFGSFEQERSMVILMDFVPLCKYLYVSFVTKNMKLYISLSLGCCLDHSWDILSYKIRAWLCS